MDHRNLRYFLAIIDHGSISGAATALDMAQPALSQALARMERELGVRLFVRSRRGAEPTAAARAMVESVRTGLARLDAGVAQARAIAQGKAGRLTIGLVSSALLEVLPQTLRALRAAVPGVQVVLREMSNAEQAEALRTGDIDVGLMHTPVAVVGRMRERLLLRERLVAAVPVDVPMAADGQVGLADIAEAGLVIFPERQLPAFYAEVHGALRKAGLAPAHVQEANRTLTVLACVAGGCGFALLPSWIRALNFHGVRFCEVRDGQDLPSFDLAAIWPARSTPGLADLFASLELHVPDRRP